jgi:hypothetical protein
MIGAHDILEWLLQRQLTRKRAVVEIGFEEHGHGGDQDC